MPANCVGFLLDGNSAGELDQRRAAKFPPSSNTRRIHWNWPQRSAGPLHPPPPGKGPFL